MLERKKCTNFDANMKTELDFADYIKRGFARIERFLKFVTKYDEGLVERLLEKYKEKLEKMDIKSSQDDFFDQFNFDYSENKLLNKYPEYFPLIENAIIKFLNFAKYESQFKMDEKMEILFKDYIRGSYPLYYLVYTLLDLESRETVINLAKEYTDFVYELYQDQIEEKETLDEMAKIMYDGGHKTHNYIIEVKEGQYFLKVTRCMWGDLYQELPDLEIAYYLECYGDFSKMPYINKEFALTRTKTLVEGYSCCDFVHHDKRIVKEIKHPGDDFWENFK